MLSIAQCTIHRTCTAIRDGNSGTGTRSDGYGYGDDFLSVGGTRTRSELKRVRDEYFFHLRVTRRVPDTLLPL
jgi:hypothetical protein